MKLDLNIEIPQPNRTVKVPQQTKSLSSCLLKYEDGTELFLEVEDSQGFHRIEKMKSNTHEITIHEVFITYGSPRASEND